MPALNWDEFAKLPGAVNANFEMLCKALVRRTYGRFGDFNAWANQPGVEFHLKLHTACSLGRTGEWYGWQCRWYDLPAGAVLGATRRQKTEETIKTAHTHFPGLTHWVLWTQRPLAAADQRWFDDLSAPFQLRRWTAAEVDEHLAGEAEILRATYFGELVLTPTYLSELHTRSVASIRSRWLPEVHQPLKVEKQLRRILCQSDAWQDLGVSKEVIVADAVAANNDIAGLTGPLAIPTRKAVSYSQSIAEAIEVVRSLLAKGELEAVTQLLSGTTFKPAAEIASLPHQLRAARQGAALTVANVLTAARSARGLLASVASLMAHQLNAVTAEAGCGKTQLAAELAAPTGDRPAGLLLHGRDLRGGDTLDNLASRVVINGMPVRTMEALVAAIDAAGKRSGHRLAIVIDGLNEAEDPRDWKAGLAGLQETLRQYSHVVVICTLRPAFVKESLPDDIHRTHIPGFEQDTADVVGRYFDYFRINPTDAFLPLGLLEHPLTLRIFCEVTNFDRNRVVGVESMPSSLTDLFDKYLEQVAERIAQLAPRRHRYYEADVLKAFVEIGKALWNKQERRLSLDDLRRSLADEGRPWDESLARALEQNGVLLRDSRDADTNAQRVIVIYDRLAGHMIAKALLEQYGKEELRRFLREEGTNKALHEAERDSHPLADDILIGMVGLTPRRHYGEQVWRMVDPLLRGVALRNTAKLDGASLDATTVDELAKLVGGSQQERDGLLHRLIETRGVVGHPLNAEFLDSVLRPLGVAERDGHWTEWIRQNEEALLDDVRWLETRWRDMQSSTQPERLRARWVMWLLTSTVQLLRDHATRSLYWFGRFDSEGLFDLAIESLAVNDASVPERMMAAAFGVVMAHQVPAENFGEVLRSFMTKVREHLLAPIASHPTNHWLIRLYAQGISDLALRYYPTSVPGEIAAGKPLRFVTGPGIEAIAETDPRAAEVNQSMRIDFVNYTLGRLIPGRGNYDMEHAKYRDALSHVRGSVWALGWRAKNLAAIDDAIAARGRYRRTGGKVDRYGKKYGWIGFYTCAGRLVEAGTPLKQERLSDLGIDPSFPIPPSQATVNIPRWVGTAKEDNVTWLRSGAVTLPDELLRQDELNGVSGPWVAVYGQLSEEDAVTGREAFAKIIALLVQETEAERLVEEFLKHGSTVWHWPPELPSSYYIFAGEIPWSTAFALPEDEMGAEDEEEDEEDEENEEDDKENDEEDDEIDEEVELYRPIVETKTKPDIEVEILGHTYAWESYHSPLNEAGGALVPSSAFSAKFDLRGVPQSFDQVEPTGTLAAKSYLAPHGFDGRLLYLREDLLTRYANGRRLVWLTWGDRRVRGHQAEGMSEPLKEIYRKGEDQWRNAWVKAEGDNKSTKKGPQY